MYFCAVIFSDYVQRTSLWSESVMEKKNKKEVRQ